MRDFDPVARCLVAECDSSHYAKGYCLKHYRRWSRHGDTTLPLRRCTPLMERLWAKVDKNGPTPEACPGPCWLWTGVVNWQGYGRISEGRAGQRYLQAHRVTYEDAKGPIPTGLEPDHLCRVRNCVNPAHLELVTHRENLLRGETFVARHAAKTRCLRGHPFTAENTYVDSAGGRNCRTCGRLRKARQRARP